MKNSLKLLFLILTCLSSCKNIEMSRHTPISHAYSFQDSVFRAFCEIKRSDLFSEMPSSFKVTLVNISDRELDLTSHIAENPDSLLLICGAPPYNISVKVAPGDSIIYDVPSHFAVFKKGRDFKNDELYVNVHYVVYNEFIVGVRKDTLPHNSSDRTYFNNQIVFKKSQ